MQITGSWTKPEDTRIYVTVEEFQILVNAVAMYRGNMEDDINDGAEPGEGFAKMVRDMDDQLQGEASY